MSTPQDHKPKLPRLLRRLTLVHDGEPFLDRWGIVWDRLGGFYVHHIIGPDPGLDLHDHPWSFVTIVLRGGYNEHVSEARDAAEREGNTLRIWNALTVHRMHLHVAHRITAVDENTWTLVLRGPTRRTWGFFPPWRWVPWTEYDYATRRPSKSFARDPRGPELQR